MPRALVVVQPIRAVVLNFVSVPFIYSCANTIEVCNLCREMFQPDILKPTPIGRLRFATVQDATDISELVNESVSRTFRVNCLDDIIYLIENAILSICQLDAYDIIIGFASVRDYPQMPGVHPSAWESYIWTKFKAIEMNARNTLFLHMLCWNPLYGREVVDSILKSMFMHDAYIHHIGMIKALYLHPHLVPGQYRSEASFRRVQVMERGLPGEKLPALLVADRKEVSPRLRIRRAVEEDNDDLVPLFDTHAPQLKELYGEFYISELISKHPESDRVLLVCEHKELAVGMMCLNTTINYDGLAESFILEPFGGLKHLDCVQEINRDFEPSMSSFFGELQCDSKQQSSSADHRVKIIDDMEDELHHEWSERRITRQVSLMGNNPEEIMTLLFQDEESAMEFDIVNIDSEHLWVPEFLCNALTGTSEAIQKIIDDFTPPKPKTKKERKTASSASTQKSQKRNGFNGTPNAFLIELFAIQPEYDERYAFDILEATFELFPNRDYCIICLPSHQPPFPLLEHFTLVTPVESRPLFKTESLYVAHINSVRGKLCVRPGERYDVPALERVLQNAPKSATILNLYQSTLSTSQLQSFVFLSENQPIGVVVIGPLDDGTTVRTQYDLEPEPRRPGTDGTVLAGVMSPALEPHSRWFLREILRQSRYSTLFWICRLFARDDAAPSRNLMSLASYMNPVHPRKVMPNISLNKDLDKMFQGVGQPFALWILERPMTGLPKIHVNCSIVVVGASRTGLSFLEALIMGPTSEYLTFSNLTLVSEHGLPTVGDCLKAADICVPRDGRYTDRYIKSVPFYFYVDVVSGVMVGIDRKKKCIHLKDGSIKNYDQLVLTCGRQFQHPEYLADALKLVKQVQAGKPCDRILMDNPKYQEDRVPPPPELPINVFLINSLYEANRNLGKLMRLKNETKKDALKLCPDNPVVVYGDCIEAYSCIAALLELGIHPKNIVFVEPFPYDEDPSAMRVNCFNNETVDERVQATLEAIGVNVFRRYHFDGWKLVVNYVERLYFMSTLHAMSVKCFALFYFGQQAINMHAFKAINESGLVYDGGLVVSPTFETNDPNIFGAGTCVSYSRRLYATRALHRNFCSEDIGEALAKLFLRKLDPFVEHSSNCDGPSELIPPCTSSILEISMPSASTTKIWSETPASYRRWQPVMKFKSPLVQYATLPGPLYYLKIRKSGKEIPMAVQKILPRQGHTLRTDYNGNYFRLQLNILHVVDAVTCLSAKPFSPDIISELFGKHEAVFNKLLDRYKGGMIRDLYEFFTQPWMSALYQESFKELNDCINEQDVFTTGDLTKSKYLSFEEEAFDSSVRRMTDTSAMSSTSVVSTTDSIRRMGTFRTLIQKYIARYNKESKLLYEDIPNECGQDYHQHKSALKFWHRVGGNRIVSAHLTKYLDRNNVCNPQYACLFSEPQND